MINYLDATYVWYPNLESLFIKIPNKKDFDLETIFQNVNIENKNYLKMSEYKEINFFSLLQILEKITDDSVIHLKYKKFITLCLELLPGKTYYSKNTKVFSTTTNIDYVNDTYFINGFIKDKSGIVSYNDVLTEHYFSQESTDFEIVNEKFIKENPDLDYPSWLKEKIVNFEKLLQSDPILDNNLDFVLMGLLGGATILGSKLLKNKNYKMLR